MNVNKIMSIGAGFAVFTVLMMSTVWAGSPQAADDAQAVNDFEARVSRYTELHKREAGSPKPTNSATKLAEIRDQLAEKIRADRAEARQGDIFTPEIAAYFRRQLAATLAGHSGAKIRASLRHAEPIHAMPLQVNAKYPQKVPLQSTPPTLLLNLPALPKELQYRIVGRALVLYDPGTDLIVDFMEAALSSE